MNAPAEQQHLAATAPAKRRKKTRKQGLTAVAVLVVLTAESNVLAQRRADADLKARALEAQVNLARALGGGYGADVQVRGGYDAATQVRGGGYDAAADSAVASSLKTRQ